MKPDTERKKYHTEKLHKRKKRMNVHLSKELRSKLKSKKRAILLHSGDTVKIMRGPKKGKEAKVSRVSTSKRKVYLEGVMATNARKKEVAVPLEPSNLLLMALESTPERKKIFAEGAFKKKEVKPPKKEEAKKEAPKPEEKKAVEEKPKAHVPTARDEKPKAPVPTARDR
jgi:ribosomal protein uL24